MASVLVEEKSLQSIADSIRKIDGDTSQFKPYEMPTAIDEKVETLKESNKRDIDKLSIKATSKDRVISVNDSADYCINGLSVYGESTQDGTPTPDNPIEIISKKVYEFTIFNGNLYSDGDKIGINSYITDFIQWTRASKIYIRCLCKTDNENGVALIFTEYYDKSKNKIGQNGNTLKVGTDYTKFAFYRSGESANAGIKVDLTKVEYVVIKFYINSNSATSIDYKDILITDDENAVFNGYMEPQTVTLTQPITLHGIGEYQDKIVYKDGVYGVEKNIYYLDKNSEWLLHGISSENKLYTAKHLCPLIKFRGLSYIMGSSTIKFNARLLNTRDIYVGESEDRIYIYGTKDTDTVESILALQPEIHCIFVLKEPTFEPLPQQDQDKLNALRSYYPSTVVMNDDNAFMQLNYIADPTNYIKGLIPSDEPTTIPNFEDEPTVIPLKESD